MSTALDLFMAGKLKPEPKTELERFIDNQDADKSGSPSLNKPKSASAMEKLAAMQGLGDYGGFTKGVPAGDTVGGILAEYPQALIEGLPGFIAATESTTARGLRALEQIGAKVGGNILREGARFLGETPLNILIPQESFKEAEYAGERFAAQADVPSELELTLAGIQEKSIESFAPAGRIWQDIARFGHGAAGQIAPIAAMGGMGISLPPGAAAVGETVAAKQLAIAANAIRRGGVVALSTQGSLEERLKAGMLATIYMVTPAVSGLAQTSATAKALDMGLNQIITHTVRALDPAVKKKWEVDPELGVSTLMDVVMALGTTPLAPKSNAVMTPEQYSYHMAQLAEQQARHIIKVEPRNPTVAEAQVKVQETPLQATQDVAPSRGTEVPEVAPKPAEAPAAKPGQAVEDKSVVPPAAPEVAPAPESGKPAAPVAPKPAEAPVPQPVRIIGEPSSIKNAYTDAARERIGLQPHAKDKPTSTAIANKYAKLRLADNPNAARELEIEIRDTHRMVDENDIALLAMRGRELANAEIAIVTRLLDARKAKNAAAIEIAETEFIAQKKESQQFYDLTNAIGREQALAFSSRYRHNLMPDYSLTAVMRRFEAERGRPPTAKELAKMEAATARIAELEKLLSESNVRGDILQQLIDETRIIRAAGKARTNRDITSPKYGARNRIVTRDNYLAAIDRLKSSTAANDIAGVSGDLNAIGVFHLEAGARDVADWTATMLASVGDKYKPYLADIYKQVQAKFQPEQRKGMLADVAAKLDNGEEIGRLAREIAKSFIEEGITEREAVLTATHDVLKIIMPEMTRRDVADAISGYGEYRKLSKDPVMVQLRAISGELQQLSKLEDMQGGIAPKMTGVERRVPTDEERRLIQKVEEAKRKGGFVVTDPERQLKSALDEIKTRLTHQIADLESQIKAGEKTVKTKVAVPLDAEAIALRETRDALREQFNEMFGDKSRKLTDAQRVKLATASVERSIAEYERRIAENDLFPDKTQTPAPTTPELDALKARRDALREELKMLQNIAHPKMTPEERATQAYKTRTMNRIAELKAMLASRDYTKPEPTAKRKLSTDEVAMRDELDRLKWQLEKQRMSPLERGWGYLEESSRFLRTIFGGDNSWILRQGRPVLYRDIGSLPFSLLTGRPTAHWFKTAVESVRSFISEEKFEDAMTDLRASPYYGRIVKAGLWTDTGVSTKQSMREESSPFKYASKMPLVNRSNRAAVIAGNAARDLLYRELAPRWEAQGRLKTEADWARLASFIGDLTGRSTLPHNEKVRVIADISNTFITSFRYSISRIRNTLTLWRTLSLHPEVSIEGAKTLAGAVALTGTAITIVNALRKDDEPIILNPLSPDAFKVKVGNTRFELLEGHGPVIRLIVQLMTSTTISSGKLKPIDRERAIWLFVRSKRAPLWGLISELFTGKNFVGQKIDGVKGWSKIMSDHLLFLWVSSAIDAFYDEYKNNGRLDKALTIGAATSAAEFVGVGTQTYNATKSRRPEIRR